MKNEWINEWKNKCEKINKIITKEWKIFLFIFFHYFIYSMKNE